jgi:multidrug resistance protein, MATE family
VLTKKYIHHYKENLKIAFPVALSQLGHIAVGMADTIMVGALGGDAMASVTIAFSVFVPFMMFGIGISYGISPLIAKADGENNHEEITKILKHSIILNIITGFFICLLLYFSSSLLGKLNQPPHVVQNAISFFQILSFTMIPLMIFQTFKQFAEGLAITRQAMYISISANILNIILNYILIYGNFGFLKVGINGAAYATLTARIFMAVFMFGFFCHHKNFSIYRKHLSSVIYSSQMYRRLLKMILPVGMQLSMEAGAFGLAALMMGWIGAREIAAHHIAITMAAVSYMAATGIAAAATVRVGNEFGKKEYRDLQTAGYSSFYIVIVFMGICALFFVLFRNQLPHLYIADQKIENIAASLLLICAFFQLSDGIQVVGLGALRGIGDVKIPTAIALISYWLVGLPLGYVFAFYFNYKAEGIWYGLFIGLTLAAIMLSVRFYIKTRELNIRNNRKEISEKK